MVNILKSEKRQAVIGGLVEGLSVRSVERMTGVHRDTIGRLAVRVGNACASELDRLMRDLPCQRVEVDEVWCFVGKKQRHVADTDDPTQVGDFWVWTAFDPDTKLIPAHHVGKRDRAAADAFVSDLSERMANRIQISSDGFGLYVRAISEHFGNNVDYARIVKSYEAEPIGPGRYSPPKVSEVEKTAVIGSPDMNKVSTSGVERSNLTLRMSSRRFTRLTNAFSKRPANLRAAVALHHAHYNLARRHGSLGTTPAMAAGVVDREWTIADLVELGS